MIVCFVLIFLLLWVAGSDLPVLRHHLGGAATHVVVGTGYGEAGSHLAEQHGAVCHAGAACSGGEVVVPSVEPGAGHHVADQLTRRHPIACSPLRGKRASRFVQSPYKPSGAFAAVVVCEHVVAGSTLPRERAGSRTSQRVVLVCASWRNRSCGDADHALVYTLLSTQKAKCTTKNAFFSKKIAVGLQGA